MQMDILLNRKSIFTYINTNQFFIVVGKSEGILSRSLQLCRWCWCQFCWQTAQSEVLAFSLARAVCSLTRIDCSAPKKIHLIFSLRGALNASHKCYFKLVFLWKKNPLYCMFQWEYLIEYCILCVYLQDQLSVLICLDAYSWRSCFHATPCSSATVSVVVSPIWFCVEAEEFNLIPSFFSSRKWVWGRECWCLATGGFLFPPIFKLAAERCFQSVGMRRARPRLSFMHLSTNKGIRLTKRIDVWLCLSSTAFRLLDFSGGYFYNTFCFSLFVDYFRSAWKTKGTQGNKGTLEKGRFFHLTCWQTKQPH